MIEVRAIQVRFLWLEFYKEAIAKWLKHSIANRTIVGSIPTGFLSNIRSDRIEVITGDFESLNKGSNPFQI